MTTYELKLDLPDMLARDAESIGLLTSQSIVRLLAAEVERQKRLQQLFGAADRLAALDLPPMSDDDVESEISAARAGRRNADVRRR